MVSVVLKKKEYQKMYENVELLLP